MKLKRILVLSIVATGLSLAGFQTSRAGQVVILKDTDDAQADDIPQPAAESQTVVTLCKESLAQMRAKNMAEAFKTVARAKAESPNSAEVARTYAYLYIEENQPKYAIRVLDDLAKTTKLTTNDLLVLGTAKWKDGNIAGATTSFKSATTLDPDSTEAVIDYIRGLLAVKDWPEAMSECDKALLRFKNQEMQTALIKMKARAATALKAQKAAAEEHVAPVRIEDGNNAPKHGGG
ncbi:MAG TPA: tetratricopeptide repeat protein [Oculatellaceae cyanobacterium]